MTDDPSRPDPVLVRPYIKPVSGRPARDPSEAPTVVQPAVVDDTSELPPVAEPPARRRGMLRPLGLRLLVLVGGVAVALAVAGWLIFHPAPDETQPGAALPPQEHRALPADAASSAARASASASASASVSPSSSLSSSPSASVDPSAGVSAPSSPSGSLPPSATLAPPPAADRTGSVKAASGRCLALGGLLGIDGSPVQVSGCADLPAQRFTLASDGTLRVSGRCAEATGDGTVRIAGCDGAGGSAQWRAGPASSLVNAANGGCLSDPGRAGATTRVAGCSGGSDQSWALP
ncbi:ricin-type beta-trefoil lectin domain protein [Actinoplanes sp. CA-030573]|uniref:ricin-type beta-trefoil lectin domain protein n=1 Tax=Actinoplanes sp. CA-030573 TaxID=3239898 RepID=UPI003D90F52B